MNSSPRRFLPALLAAALLAPLVAWPALAQDRGGLSGRVTDKRSGHAIPFANVSVPEAKRGGLTDSEGQFNLTGIPPGTWEIRVQFLGYKPESRAGVVVSAGRTATANFQLEEIVVREEKAIEVTAERRLVEVRQGTTIRSVNASEIRNLPVQTVSDVLQQQAGINTENDQIHVRGGRTDETIFVVNGVANRDLVTGQSTAGQLNARSVAEVNVATGAYDVRYGNALSGVVEVKLREGGDRLSGGLTMTGGSYGGRQVQVVVGGPDPVLGSFMRTVFGFKGSVSSILDVSGTLSETRFRSLGRAEAGYLEGVGDNLFPPPRAPLRSSYRDFMLGDRLAYGPFFTSAEDNRWAARYALSVKPNEKDKLMINLSKRLAIDQGFSRTFINAAGDAGDPAYPWIWAHRIDHAPTILEDNVQASLQWRRTLSHTGFTEMQASRYFTAYRQDVQGKMWDKYEEPNDFSLRDSVQASDYFIDTGDDNSWEDRRSTSYGLNWSLTQRFRRHEVEIGFEHQFQTVQRVRIEDPWVYDPNGLGGKHDQWRVHPWVGDFYVRDRLEYEGFTANVGLRGDYWFIGKEAERAVADENSNVSPTTRAEFYRDTRPFFGRRYKLKLSPRLIVAHPISEHSSFFFNYGEFTQIPSYRFVYSKLTSISSESFPNLGNPNLNPQVSVNYELGAKHQFLPTAAVNATFFVKDIYDYPASTTFKRQQGASLVDIFVYLNGHFARSKGFEIELEKRRSNNWSGRLVYTYQQTKGKSSDANQAKVLQEGGGDASETPLAQTFVTWNRPHKVTASFDMRFDDAPPERWGFLRHAGINLYVQGQVGRAYTPYKWQGGSLRASGETNSKNGPFQITTDLRANRYFTLGARKFDVSLSGTNVFNNFIVNRVDRVTGDGREWGDGEYDPRRSSAVNDRVHVSEVDDPSNYGPGAQWRMQLDYDF
jgi:hypothetical protein